MSYHRVSLGAKVLKPAPEGPGMAPPEAPPGAEEPKLPWIIILAGGLLLFLLLKKK